MSNPVVDPAELLSSEDPVNLFELTEELAVGAFGAVYSATYLPTQEIVAVKICALEDEDSLGELLGEISILKHISHENCIKFFGAYQKDQELFIAMELADGGAVNTLFEAKGKLPESVISYVIRESLKGLVYLHETCHIIHRDIKAPNVLLTRDGFVKLADFGVSAVLSSPTQKRKTFVGTPWWMAPEIIEASHDHNVAYDYKVDIWALGIMCIELAQAMPPLCNLQPMDVLYEILNRENPPELQDPENWSQHFPPFIATCLKRNIDDRPTARALLSEPFITTAKGTNLDVRDLIDIVKKKQEEAETAPSEDDDDDDDEVEEVGFRSKTMAAKLATTKTLKTYRPSPGVEGGGKTQRITLKNQVAADRIMHQQLRQIKKQQKEAAKLLEALDQKHQAEIVKLEKKKLERIANLEKEEKRILKKTEKDQQQECEAMETKAAAELKALEKAQANRIRDDKKAFEADLKEKSKANKDALKKHIKELKKSGAPKDEIKSTEAESEMRFQQILIRENQVRENAKLAEHARQLTRLRGAQIETLIDTQLTQMNDLLQKKEDFKKQRQKIEIDFVLSKHELEIKHTEAHDAQTTTSWQEQQNIKNVQYEKGLEEKDKEQKKTMRQEQKLIEKRLKDEEKKANKESRFPAKAVAAHYKEKKTLETQQHQIRAQTNHYLDRKLKELNHTISREEDLCRLHEQQVRRRLKIKREQLEELQKAEQVDNYYEEVQVYIEGQYRRISPENYIQLLRVYMNRETDVVLNGQKQETALLDEHFQQLYKLYASYKKNRQAVVMEQDSESTQLRTRHEKVSFEIAADQQDQERLIYSQSVKKGEEFLANKERLQREKEREIKLAKEKHNERLYYLVENQFRVLREVIEERLRLHQILSDKGSELKESVRQQIKREADLLNQQKSTIQYLKADENLQRKMKQDLDDRERELIKQHCQLIEKETERMETLYKSKMEHLEGERKKTLDAFGEWKPEKLRKERRKSQPQQLSEDENIRRNSRS